MRILYIHGFNGTPEGHSFSLLNKHLPEGAQIFGMDYCQDDCALALEQIARTISEKNIDILVGSSLGGFLTILTTGIERYAVNPCYSPSAELPKLGPQNGLPAPSPEMTATYAAVEPRLRQLDEEDRKRVHVLMGDKDGRTAICPHCFIDAVLPDSNPYGISPDFLRKMREKWF